MKDLSGGFKFSERDLQQIEATRIYLEEGIPQQLIDLAESYNQQLDNFIDMLKEYLTPLGINAPDEDAETLLQLGQHRRVAKFGIVKSLLLLLNHRADARQTIGIGLKANADAFREAYKATYAEQETQLKPHFEGQPDWKITLDASVTKTIVVQNAERDKQRAAGRISAMTTPPNVDDGTFNTLRSDWSSRLTAMASEFAFEESLPESVLEEGGWRHGD